jgi:hypothetical protein
VSADGGWQHPSSLRLGRAILGDVRRLNSATVVFLVLASLWGVAQFVLAFFVHVTARARETSAGLVVPPTKTYMQDYAVSEIVLTVVIVALTVCVAVALHGRATRGVSGVGRLAWGISIVTTLLGLLGFAYLFGVGICLLLACASVPRRRREAKVHGAVTPTPAGIG